MKISLRNFLLLLCLLFQMQWARAQDDPQYRMEIGAGVGMVAYEGDLNGNVFANQQPMGAFVGRYNFDPYKDLRLNLAFGKLKGSTDKVETYYPDYHRGAKRLVPFVLGGLGATFVKGAGKNVFTANVPLGIGAKYKVTDRLNIGVDWTIHFSLNDELDGVKDPYLIKSSGAFKNTDCYSMLQLSLTYSFSERCKTCNKED